MKSIAFRTDVPLRMSALALIMATVMALSGCWFKASWITKAEQDLPILIQMAESIASFVTVVHNGQAPSPEEIAAIQHISAVGTAGLQAIQVYYNSYTSANATTVIQEIQAAGAALTTNLNQLLAAAQIKNPGLLQSVNAAVGLIVSSLNTFLSLLPGAPQPAATKARGRAQAKLPGPSDLRRMWKEQVGVPLVQNR